MVSPARIPKTFAKDHNDNKLLHPFAAREMRIFEPKTARFPKTQRQTGSRMRGENNDHKARMLLGHI